MYLQFKNEHSFIQLMSIVHSTTAVVYGHDFRTRRIHYWTYRFKTAIDNNDHLEYNSLLAGLIEDLIGIAQEKPFDNTYELQLTRVLADYQKFSTYDELANSFYDYRMILLANYENNLHDDEDEEIDYVFTLPNSRAKQSTLAEEPNEVSIPSDEFDFSELDIEPELIEIETSELDARQEAIEIPQNLTKYEALEFYKKKLQEK